MSPRKKKNPFSAENQSGTQRVRDAGVPFPPAAAHMHRGYIYAHPSAAAAICCTIKGLANPCPHRIHRLHSSPIFPLRSLVATRPFCRRLFTALFARSHLARMKHTPASSPHSTPSKQSLHLIVEKPVPVMPSANPSQWDRRAFDCIDCERRGYLLKHEILRHIESNGVSSHIQLQSMIKALEGKGPTDPISLQEFAGLVLSCNFVKKVFESRLIIPEYSAFHRNFWEVYREIKADGDGRYSKGTCADYIPSLGKADPSWFGTSFCSIHGQYSAFGDSMTKFSMQSVSKVAAYAMIYEIYAQKNGGNGDGVHEFVGAEPSGQRFNAAVFDKKGRPHNPMVNAGAIMVSTLLVHEGKTVEDFQKFYMSASCAPRADIDLPLYKEEAMTGCNNHALRSLMLARGVYPQKSRFEETRQLADDGLDFYFVQCSMLVDCEGMARFGAMLANNGVNPSTNERIVSPATVKATISLMHSCGMYDGAGQFGKDHGAPTKSGVAGGLMTVIPGIGAIASFSPPLNDEGNCVRGIYVIEKLSEKYSNINLFHKDFSKADMLKKPFETKIQTVVAACMAASCGDR